MKTIRPAPALIHRSRLVLWLWALAALPVISRAAPPFFEEHTVWARNEDGMLTFHVPTIFVSHRGTVLAAADARFKEVGDFAPHHIAYKRSTDGGRTWGKNNYVARSDGTQIYLFPNFIQPRGSERIFFFYSEKDVTDIHHVTHVWLRHSDDDGITWSKAEDVVDLLVQHDAVLKDRVAQHKAGPQFDKDNPQLYGRRAFFTGPGVAIQLRATNPKAPNRLIVPVLGMQDRWVYDQQRGQFNTLLLSDDDGRTWRAGGAVPIGEYANSEPSIVELADGSLLFNIRVEHQYFRVVSTSADGGDTWTVAKRAVGFPAYDQVHSGLLRLSFADSDPTQTNRLLFCFPAGAMGPDHHPKRENMTVWMSYDEHRTWPVKKVINPGPSYYSNMALMPDRSILLVYGRDGGHPYMPERTVVAHFNLEWLTEGKDSLGAGPRAATGGTK